MKITVPVIILLLLNITDVSAQTTFETVKTFQAEYAHQAVAVDSSHFYAISSTVIGKYHRESGKLEGRWTGGEQSGIIHLDSGVVVNGKLYAAHSNYPEIPMTSSVEVWDSETMHHIDSYSFGNRWGSLTWLDRHKGYWWGVFAHYLEFREATGKDNRWTQLVKFNDRWQPLESWLFPEEVLDKFGTKSNSGGSWGPDGNLYISGHDLPEIYAMKLPEAGSRLKLLEVIPIENEGQGIAWDRFRQHNLLFTIRRSTREVVVSRKK